MVASNNEIPIGEGNNIVVGKSEALCRCFLLSEIRSATNDFDEELVIGSGGFGKVYKGFMDDGGIDTTVAIKRSDPDSKQGAEEFWTEVKNLSELRHTHLVSLIGYCNEGEEMILVYEYMENGSLADHLYKIRRKGGGNHGLSLTWEQRLTICIHAARGIDHLHSGAKKGFIHRDVKTTNILLDEKLVAKISDFGLSKYTASQSKTHVSTKVKGTYGYLDPEYFLFQRLTKKSDVYAFGVVILEVLCGRPAVDTTLEEDQISLVLWAQQHIREGRFDQIMDPSLIGQIPPRSLKHLLKLSKKCLHNLAKGRPTMAQVIGSLEFVWASNKKETKDGIMSKLRSIASTLNNKKEKNVGTISGLSSVSRGETHLDGSISGPSRVLPSEALSERSISVPSRVYQGEALLERSLSEPSRGFRGEAILETPTATPQRSHPSFAEVLSTHKVFR